jgi:4-amino-4-deoxy-L-arabinose transferase-like glycosyltransferase
MRDVSTSLDMTEGLMRSRAFVWAVGAIALVLFAGTNLPWQLDDYDQAKQAFTSFEMVKEGHWLYQRTPHERVATKPPLVGWISAGLYEVTRSWDLAWRLPSLGAAIALSILLYRAGGLFAFGAFAFNLLSPRLASLVRTDMPLALVVFAIGLMIWNQLREQRVWSVRDQLSIFTLLTAAMLIKGPIVCAFLLPAVAIFWWRREKIPWWPWLASLGIFILWVVGGCLLVPKFYDQVVVREFLGRFGETIHRPQPVWFYFAHLLHKFAPWSLLLVALAIVDLRTRQDRHKLSPETLWLICWSLGGLLVMSLIPSKRVDRIFPVISPLCLLLAIQIGSAGALRRHENDDAAARRRYQRWIMAVLWLSILYAGGYSVWKVYTGYRDHRDALVRFGEAARRQATSNHWRYEVSDAPDEGLLLYCDKLHFVRRNDAVAKWNQDEVDGLIVPIDQVALFADATAILNDVGGRYALIAHGK